MKFRFTRASQAALSALILSFSASTTVFAEAQGAQNAGPAPQGQMSHGQMAQPEMTAEQKNAMMELRSLQQQMQTTQQTLQKTEQKAFSDTPKLVQQRDKLQATMFEKMSDKGYDAKKELNALQTMMADYQKNKPTQDQIGAFRKREAEFQQRQQKAFQDPEVKKQVNALKTDVEAKMTQIDPQTPKLIQQMQTQSKRFMELRQKMMHQ